MKLGVVDLSFHWPPAGGSWVVVAEVCRRLPRWGVEVVLIVPQVRTADMARGLLRADPGFRVVPVPVSARQFNWRRLPALLARVLREECPDRVWLTNTFNLAPPVLAGLSEWPVVWRVFGYEVFCPNYMSLHPRAMIARWGEQNPAADMCPTNYFRSPLRCTVCALRGMRTALHPRRRNNYSHEWVVSGAWLPGYASRSKAAIQRSVGVMVNNILAEGMARAVTPRVRVVPGGVDLDRFFPGRETPDDVVLMAGRVDDPRKGFSVYAKAVALLRERGWSGSALATSSRVGEIAPGVFGTGWVPYGQMADLYRGATIVVIPTLWPEPFGLVALEAMACARPVVASAIGGLTSTVGETELTFSPGDAPSLARLVEQLLKDREYRDAKATEARAVAERYGWERVLERHHLRLLAGPVSWWYEATRPIFA